MPALTPADLAAFLAAVPVSNQQRDAAVRVSPRPGLAADHRGPVAPGDVRLALSPWHWLRGELAHSPRTEALNRALAAARAAGDAPDLATVAGVADWLETELATSGLDWYPVPDEPSEWGDWDPLMHLADTATGTFLPPQLALPAVLFFTDYGQAEDLRLVVAQAHWQEVAGPVGIYTSADCVAEAGSAYPEWLMGAAALLLTDPVTGEQAELSPCWTDDDDDGQGEDAAIGSQAAEWGGQEPRFEAGTFYKSDQGPVPDWLRENLHYAAGRLSRADSGQALSLAPYLLPEPHPR